MFYGLVQPPQIAELGARSRPFLSEPPEDVADAPLITPTGSLTLFDEDQRAQADAMLALARRLGVAAEALGADRLARVAAHVAREGVATAVFCPTDGVIDIHGLVQGLLRAGRRRGARVELGEEVRALWVEAGRVRGVVTARGRMPAAAVVDATGAWAGLLASVSGASRIPLVPYRRHLVFVRAESQPGPLAIDRRRLSYIRPETGGYLGSPCDEDPHPPGTPGVEPERVAEGLACMERLAPALLGSRPARSWACLRTRTPDEGFVIGWDPELRGFFWMAGLGGHGMTAGVAAGDLAAAVLAGEAAAPPWTQPARFREAVPQRP
jgi:D-arginine dehydrogenase